MNEKIKELAKQAGYGFEIHLSQSGDEEYIWGGVMETRKMEKFTELIIEECGVSLSPMLRDMISRGKAYDLIKEHFGIK